LRTGPSRQSAHAYAAPPGPAAIRPPKRRIPQRRRARADAAQAIDLGVFLFTALAIVTALTISPSLLTNWKIQYVTAGGGFYEKLHPATYCVVLALCLSLLRNANPVRELVRIFASSWAIPFYLFCWMLLLVQTMQLERPFTGIVDTFLLPPLVALAIWQTPAWGRRWLVVLLHLLILVNVVIGYYEFAVGHRIIPLTLGNVVVLGEWRSAALLGHPLVASGLLAGYILALVLRPQLCPQPLLRLPLIFVCLGSLMVFGGRTALVTTLLVIALALAFDLLRLLRGGRVPLPVLILGAGAILAGAAVLFAALDLGLFDKMLLRFSSDKGSALARVAMLDLLSHLDWNEILFAPTVSRANALQSELGLEYGIENFWIASIVQFGLVHTLLTTAAIVAFFAMLLRQSSPAAWAQMVLIAIIAASSVSFSSKNIQLAQFVILIGVLLPRDRVAPAAARAVPARPRPHVVRPLRAGSLS
jgi:hypothetical protein